MAKLKILQLNTRSLKANKISIEALLINENVDVGIFCETWIKPNEEVKISSYNVFSKTRDDGYGGVAIVTKTNLNAVEINTDFNPVESIEVKINIKNVDYSFLSLYIPPNISNVCVKNKFTDIINQYDNKNRLFIGGDLNARHSLWEVNGRTNGRGNIIANEINNSNLCLLNNGQFTYQNIFKNIFTTIDLSLVSTDLRNNVNYKVTEDNVGSDHLPIICEIGRQDNSPRIIYLDKIDYSKLSETLVNVDLQTAQNIEEFENLIENNIKNCTYKIKINKKHSPKPWWNSKLQKLWLIKRFKQRIYYQNQTYHTAIELKKACAKFKREAKIEKEKCWNNFIEEINPNSSLKSIYNKINLFNPTKDRSRRANTFLDSDDKLKKLMLHNYAHNAKCINFNYLREYNNDEITAQEITKIINNNKNTAPGENGISNKILKFLSEDQITILAKLLQKMWNAQEFPNNWNLIKAITFKKPGKDETQFSSYRIISLLNVIYKVFNKYLKSKLNEIISNNNLLPENSFGFRFGRGTNEFTVSLVQTVEQNKKNQYITAIISIDLQKAFDTINLTVLVNSLMDMKIDKKYIFWITQMLSNRHLKLCHNGFNSQICLNDGIPQGDVLSPILFNLYTATIHQLQSEDIIILQYADDFAFLIRDKDSSTLNLKANMLMCNLNILLNTLNFNINTNKTKYMCNNNSIFSPLIISISNDIIKQEIELKILGIIIDNNLKFVKHYKEMKEKCIKFANVLKIFNNKKNGAHPKTLLNAYKSLIKSRIFFGAATTNFNKKSVQIAQTTLNAALRSVMNFTRTTPITAVMAESGEWPIEYTKELLNIKFICKHLFNNTKFANDILKLECTDSINHTYTNNPILKLIPSKIHFTNSPINLFVHHFVYGYSKNNITSLNLNLSLKEINLYKHYKSVYTDASIKENKVGIGIFIEETGERIGHTFANLISIKSAEIIAIFTAIKYMIAMGKIEIVVFTDSKSSCISIINTIKKNNEKYFEQKIIKLLIDNPQCSVTIQWVPAHIGIPGNETADEIAKEAITNNLPHLDIKLVPNDIIYNCKISLHEKWTLEYNNQTLTKGTFNAEINQNNPHLKPWFNNSSLTHKQIKLINRLRTGHTFDKHFKYLMKIEDNNLCNTCNTKENAIHIIDSCTKFNTIRHKYKIICEKGLKEILKSGKDKEMLEIVKFVEEIGETF